jgi:hypothetical protein
MIAEARRANQNRRAEQCDADRRDHGQNRRRVAEHGARRSFISSRMTCAASRLDSHAGVYSA